MPPGDTLSRFVGFGDKIRDNSKNYFQTQGFGFLFLSQRARRDAFGGVIAPKTPVLKLNRPFASKPPAAIVQHSSLYSKKHGAKHLSHEDRRAIDFICGYIASNLGEDLSCSHLAGELYMGQTKLKALFKAATGTSPSRYVARERMEEASRLLVETDFTIAEIGKMVGYTKPGAFTEAFRKNKGCTPVQFRSEH